MACKVGGDFAFGAAFLRAHNGLKDAAPNWLAPAGRSRRFTRGIGSVGIAQSAHGSAPGLRPILGRLPLCAVSRFAFLSWPPSTPRWRRGQSHTATVVRIWGRCFN